MTATLTAPAAPEQTDRRYVVKWTDSTSGYRFGCGRRDLTFDQAAAHAAQMVRRTRRFYGHGLSDIRVAYQCDCGRDLKTPDEPHTVPNTAGKERCPGAHPSR